MRLNCLFNFFLESKILKYEKNINLSTLKIHIFYFIIFSSAINLRNKNCIKDCYAILFLISIEFLVQKELETEMILIFQISTYGTKKNTSVRCG